MRYLLDTNAMSEIRKGDRANRGVQAWMLSNDPALWAVSVVSIGEIRKGIEDARRTDAKQARAIEKWLEGVLADFAAIILPVTTDIAERWGRLLSATGCPDLDGFIAATALEHDLTIVTRNVDDFRASGARVHNPWK